MYRFRNRVTTCLITLVAIVNTLVLIINPEKYGIELAASNYYLPSDSEDNGIQASYENDYLSQAQQLPEQQFKLTYRCTIQPVTNHTQFFQPFAPVFTTNINKPGSRYLPPRNFPELNEIELFILHRRLNT